MDSRCDHEHLRASVSSKKSTEVFKREKNE